MTWASAISGDPATPFTHVMKCCLRKPDSCDAPAQCSLSLFEKRILLFYGFVLGVDAMYHHQACDPYFLHSKQGAEIGCGILVFNCLKARPLKHSVGVLESRGTNQPKLRRCTCHSNSASDYHMHV